MREKTEYGWPTQTQWTAECKCQRCGRVTKIECPSDATSMPCVPLIPLWRMTLEPPDGGGRTYLKFLLCAECVEAVAAPQFQKWREAGAEIRRREAGESEKL